MPVSQPDSKTLIPGLLSSPWPTPFLYFKTVQQGVSALHMEGLLSLEFCHFITQLQRVASGALSWDGGLGFPKASNSSPKGLAVSLLGRAWLMEPWFSVYWFLVVTWGSSCQNSQGWCCPKVPLMKTPSMNTVFWWGQWVFRQHF